MNSKDYKESNFFALNLSFIELSIVILKKFGTNLIVIVVDVFYLHVTMHHFCKMRNIKEHVP